MAQNSHPMAQPACDEMHSVSRGGSGMSTDSIARPALELEEQLARVVAPRAPTSRGRSAGSANAPASASRSARGRSLMASKTSTPR